MSPGMEAGTIYRDYSNISPSAKSILLLKGLTDIPFARETAGLIVAPEVYRPDLENKDMAFWKRVVHFEQRYWSIDRTLSGLGIPSIIEIASGISFRGLDTVRQSRVHYIDSDLPGSGFVVDGESNIEFSKLSSLRYLPGNASVPQLQALEPSHKIRTTWLLKAANY